MKFKDENIFGLVVWGTKRGKNVFLSCNIEEDAETIDNALYDIRTPVQFPGVNLIFYSFEHNHRYSTFTIYRTIYDWANRLGYYAVSLLLPANKTFADGSAIPDLLKSLSEIYWEKYIAPNFTPNRIRENIQEDKRIFDNELQKEWYALKPAGHAMHNYGSQKCTVRFKDPAGLAAFFDNYLREDLFPYSQAIILPANQPGLTCSYPEIVLKPVEKKYDLTIRIYDRDADRIVEDATIKVEKNGLKITELPETVPTGIYLISGLVQADKIELLIKKTGYKDADPVIFVQKLVEDSGKRALDYPVRLEPKPPQTNYTIPPPAKTEDKQPAAQLNQTHGLEGNRTREKPPAAREGRTHENTGTIPADTVIETPPQPAGTSAAPAETPQNKSEDKDRVNRLLILIKEIFKKIRKNWLIIVIVMASIAGGALITHLATSGKKTAQESDYTRYKAEIDSIVKAAQGNWVENEKNYTDYIGFYDQMKSRLGQNPEPAVNSLIRLLEPLKTTCLDRFKITVNSTIESINFDTTQVDMLIKVNQKLKPYNNEFQSDSSRLKQYRTLCDWITYANVAIRSNTSTQPLGRISDDLDTILGWKMRGERYSFLTQEQENIINLYITVINGMKSNNENLDNYLRAIKINIHMDPGLRSRIESLVEKIK